LFKRILFTDDIKPENVPASAQNLAFICERVLDAGSRPASHIRLNFYKMFYDKVLTDYEILYAMPTRYGKVLKYKFLAVKNWNQEYEMVKKKADQYWLTLRGKSGTNKVNDAIGINV